MSYYSYSDIFQVVAIRVLRNFNTVHLLLLVSIVCGSVQFYSYYVYFELQIEYGVYNSFQFYDIFLMFFNDFITC